MYPLSLLFLLHFFDTPGKTQTYISSGTARAVFQTNSKVTPVPPLTTLVLHTEWASIEGFLKNSGNFNHRSIQSQLKKSYLLDLHKYKPSKTFHLQRGF